MQELVIHLVLTFGTFSTMRLVTTVISIVPSSGGAIICIFSYVACVMLKSLSEDVKNCSKWAEIQICRTKRHYGHVCQFVEEIDKCFGAVYLILTISTFIRTINNTFYALVSYQRDVIINSLTSMLYTVKDFVIFVIFIYIADRIRREVV